MIPWRVRRTMRDRCMWCGDPAAVCIRARYNGRTLRRTSCLRSLCVTQATNDLHRWAS